MEQKSRVHLLRNGILQRCKKLQELGWNYRYEGDNYCIALSILLDYQTNRPTLKQVMEMLALFENFATIRVKTTNNEIVLFIQ